MTDRPVMWRAVSAVLAVAVVVTVIETLASAEPVAAAWSGVFPLAGAVVAPIVGPRLRPRSSFRLGLIFMNLGIASAAFSTYVWRGTPLGVAEMFHYVTVVMFAAVFFDRRDVVQRVVAITAINAVVVFSGGYTPSRLLVWLLATLVVAETGIVVSFLVMRQRALSYRDALTGAPNRRMWDLTLSYEIEECGRRHRPVAVLMIDMDDFKGVNAARGHEGGDEVLRSVFAAWSLLVRSSDLLARLGGDEFALLLPGCESSAAAVRVAEALLAACHEATGTTCSIGVASMAVVPDGSPGEVVTTLMQVADRQLYGAKAAGRARVGVAEVVPSGRDAGVIAEGFLPIS